MDTSWFTLCGFIELKSTAHNALFLFELCNSLKINFRVRISKTECVSQAHGSVFVF